MEKEHRVLRIKSLPEAMKRSTVAFWCVAVLHTVLIMAYHLFANYSGHFLFEVSECCSRPGWQPVAVYDYDLRQRFARGCPQLMYDLNVLIVFGLYFFP